ncbi:MAG TPA: DUF1552 domain-containing protein [Polyangium sp.]|nr:DUF1552 domain-containing protein [Polyangium sp.]
MKRTKLSRRTMLRGMVGGVAVGIGLPALEIFLNRHGTAYAAGDALPKRFGIFFWGNGMLPDLWTPAKTGTTWDPSPTLMPLADVKDKINVITGMKVYTGSNFPHGSGAVGILSGAPFANDNKDDSTFSVPSIDQVIAAAIGQDTRFRSLETSVQAGGAGWSYNGVNSRNTPESSPAAFFNRVFVDGFVMPGSMAPPDPRLPLRKSILDGVIDEATALQGVLGSTDKARLEQHLDGIRTLEKQIEKLQQNPPALLSCAVPPKPLDEYPDIDGRPQLSEISRVLVDTLVMALACDQTRVFSHWFSHSVSNILFPLPNIDSGHHQLTHDEPTPQPKVASILLYIMEEFRYMIKALAAVPEGDTTLLDHCAILGTSDCSLGQSHSVEEYPIIIAGGCNGALQTGIHYRSASSENTSKVLLTLARAMGLTLDSYGKGGGLVTSSLSAIEV